ncbi:Cytosine-specific methyltransferase [Melia azedarach]|uniref:Cytosine-specific methyltransferase n=1 Tax=Melia azedarach TaxID=155640 RepID=A0ACC1YKY4_MELAZ|nr:Cytosine-specific methyltransferase [Melia azedarach]
MPSKRRSTRSSQNETSSKKSKSLTAEPETRVDGEGTEASVENSASDSVSSREVQRNQKRASKTVDSVRKLPVRGEKDDDDESEARFIGDLVPDEEARRRWPKRYEEKKKRRTYQAKIKDDDDEEIVQARCHYTRAEVDGRVIYDLYDDAHVKAEDGEENYISQWYYRASDTIDLEAKKSTIPTCDYYCDMQYLLPYSTFISLLPENKRASSETSSTISSDIEANECEVGEHQNIEVTLLDLYSGCGAMSTGLCLGANLSGLNLVTRWAVDLNKYACESLKSNHPETEVRNEAAEDFLSLLKEWKKLCICFSLIKSKDPQEQLYYFDDEVQEEDNDSIKDDGEDDPEVFEVEKILAICYGDPKEKGERGLHLKVRWKNYGPDEDTWEPIEGLSNCRERIKDFIVHGYKSKILPLPGDVDVICGGPPCQGVSGFNRFRNKDNPLADEKNKQLVVFMDIVEYLKPRFVLMENVVDIVKFAKGYLGRYALGRLIQMNYQVRMGMMAAGAYGLPQFRMRVFLWGAQPTEKLPQYALPTHDVVLRGVIPTEFERNTVAYDEGQEVELEKKLLLKDAISDLPAVGNYESGDEMPYDRDPETEFQRFIRLRKDEMLGSSSKLNPKEHLLYDHRPLELNQDDYERVCRIPKKKGANFRDLPGVRVRPDNKVEWDPDVERIYLKSGKPLVPNYAMSFIDGSSSKPFARLWWDETVPTVVTRAEPHNQAILHPEQDRVLSIRENARLQGFPDYYKLCGPIKERYIQVGNAVAVPVSRALGYALGLAGSRICN